MSFIVLKRTVEAESFADVKNTVEKWISHDREQYGRYAHSTSFNNCRGVQPADSVFRTEGEAEEFLTSTYDTPGMAVAARVEGERKWVSAEAAAEFQKFRSDTLATSKRYLRQLDTADVARAAIERKISELNAVKEGILQATRVLRRRHECQGCGAAVPPEKLAAFPDVSDPIMAAISGDLAQLRFSSLPSCPICRFPAVHPKGVKAVDLVLKRLRVLVEKYDAMRSKAREEEERLVGGRRREATVERPVWVVVYLAPR